MMDKNPSKQVEKSEKPIELYGCIAYPTGVDCPVEWCRKARGQWCKDKNEKWCRWRNF